MLLLYACLFYPHSVVVCSKVRLRSTSQTERLEGFRKALRDLNIQKIDKATAYILEVRVCQDML